MKSKPITMKQLANRVYFNAKARVDGRGSRERSRHLYKGLPICERKEFVEWAVNNKAFKRLYKNWEATGYDIRFVPSPDRMDSFKGYVVGNMEWVPFTENCSRGRKSARGLNLKEGLDKITFELNHFISKLNSISINL